MIVNILAPIFVFAVIVLVHEGGHFLLAKATGMRVIEFAVGFGPRIVSRKIGETLYSLRIIPLGGFNRIAGMDSEATEDPKAFSKRPVWARLLVISAGSVFNVLLAYFIYAGVFLYEGYYSFPNIPVVGTVLENSAAAKSGIRPGDRIISINEKDISTWTNIGEETRLSGNGEISLTLQSGEERRNLHLSLKENEEGRRIIGITPYMEHQEAGFFKALSLSFNRCVFLIRMMGGGLINMISGHEADVAGPIGVARMATEVADTGILPLFLFIALLSLNLGFLNLLPVPLLDGGVLVMTLIEGISGRKLPEKALYYIQAVGVTILLGLFIFAMCNDINGLLK